MIRVVALTLGMALISIACAETRGVNFYRMDLEGRQTWGAGADRLLVRSVKVSVPGAIEENGTKTYRILFENVDRDPQEFEYSVVWYDRLGAKRAAHGNWKRLSLAPRSEAVEKVTPPADGDASAFEIAIQPAPEDR